MDRPNLQSSESGRESQRPSADLPGTTAVMQLERRLRRLEIPELQSQLRHLGEQARVARILREKSFEAGGPLAQLLRFGH